MIARGALGNPWVFEELTGRRTEPPQREEVAAELLWVIDRAEEHLGTERAGRYLRKFYPWYVEPLGAPPSSPTSCSAAPTCPRARRLIGRCWAAARRPRYNPATSGPGVVTQSRRTWAFFGSRSRFPPFSIRAKRGRTK